MTCANQQLAGACREAAFDRLRQASDDLLQTIDLHTDCMSNQIHRESLDKWMEALEQAVEATNPVHREDTVCRDHKVSVLIKSSLDLASEMDGLKAAANIPQEEKDRILAIVERTYDACEQLGEVIISDAEPHPPTASCAPSFTDVAGKYADARN